MLQKCKFHSFVRSVCKSATIPFSFGQRAAPHPSLAPWISQNLSKIEVQTDIITANPIHNLSITLDREDQPPKEGDELPPNWHLLFFHPQIKEKDLAFDGYEKTFSPPPPFDSRVWAGSTIQFNTSNPLKIGQDVVQETLLKSVDVKQGSRGETVFVTLQKKISNKFGESVLDTRSLAYMMEKPKTYKQVEAKKQAQFERNIDVTSIFLFRYSALTFNSHRIHYDLKYAMEEEHYPGLLVHGPLTSTLLVDLVRRQFPDKKVAMFQYRALSPLFWTGNPKLDRLTVCGRLDDNSSCEVWAKDSNGFIAMSGTVTFTK